MFRFEYGARYTPEQTVFVDESSFDRRTAIRQRGWAYTGMRVMQKCFFVRGKRYVMAHRCCEPATHILLIGTIFRYSLLPALSLDGILYVKIVEGSFTKLLFREFIEGLLHNMQPFPGPNSVIVMDNARIHKDPAIVELIEAR